jgi:hypothetical protein
MMHAMATGTFHFAGQTYVNPLPNENVRAMSNSRSAMTVNFHSHHGVVVPVFARGGAVSSPSRRTTPEPAERTLHLIR